MRAVGRFLSTRGVGRLKAMVFVRRLGPLVGSWAPERVVSLAFGHSVPLVAVRMGEAVPMVSKKNHTFEAMMSMNKSVA